MGEKMGKNSFQNGKKTGEKSFQNGKIAFESMPWSLLTVMTRDREAW